MCQTAQGVSHVLDQSRGNIDQGGCRQLLQLTSNGQTSSEEHGGDRYAAWYVKELAR